MPNEERPGANPGVHIDGESNSASVAHAAEKRRVRAKVRKQIAADPFLWLMQHPEPLEPLDDCWKKWVNAANRLLLDGARLAKRSDADGVGTYSALGKLIYERITERKIDTEIRHLLDGKATP